MYFKKKENFTFNSTVNYKPVITDKAKFPTWALILILLIIALIIGLILYKYRKNKKTQTFGFLFY